MAAVRRAPGVSPKGSDSSASPRRIRVDALPDAFREVGVSCPLDRVVVPRPSVWALFTGDLPAEALSFVEAATVEAFERATDERSGDGGATWWLVSVPSGFELRVPDVRALARSAHAHGARLVADISSVGAFGCDAVALGADFSVELRPASCSDAADLQRRFDAARAIAEYLRCHPGIPCTWYPGFKTHPDFAVAARTLRHGFGSKVTFELPQHMPARAFIERFETMQAAESERDPLPTRLEPLDGADGHLVCLIAGLDDPIDIADDLDQAHRWFCNPPEP